MASRNVLLMKLGSRRIAVLAELVQQVERAVWINALPGAPPLVEGVIDVHGALVPVLDLRSRFGDPRTPVSPDEQMVIALVRSRRVAFRVDAVLGLGEVTEERLEGVELGPGVRWSVGRDGEGVVVIEDLAALLSGETGFALDRALAAAASRASG